MVFILMTACCALVVGRILGELIRCPLAFCTFWLLAMNCALASTTECYFHVFDNANENRDFDMIIVFPKCKSHFPFFRKCIN